MQDRVALRDHNWPPLIWMNICSSDTNIIILQKQSGYGQQTAGG